MRSFFKGFLRFSDREYRGSLALAIFTILLLGVLKILPRYFQPEPLVVVQGESALMTEASTHTDGTDMGGSESVDTPGSAETLFAFNPNNLPIADWMRLGLTRKQAESVHRYEQAGGSFRIKKDVKRLFVVDDADYRRWEPYILLPDHLDEKKTYSTKNPLKGEKPLPAVRKVHPARVVSPSIDLNQADTTLLKTVRGIGSYTARQIIWYRDRLGGFVHLDQLGEVRGIRPENLESIREQVNVTGKIQGKIQINLCGADTLGRHPYISWDQARAIENYRKQHGAYTSEEDLLEIHLINPEDLERLIPYLDFRNEEDKNKLTGHGGHDE